MQTDTASSVRNDVAALRAALDAGGHPALLVVDCIACLACDRFEMDAWGVDVMVAACQKGLMTPPGMAFTFHGPRAEAARCAAPAPTGTGGRASRRRPPTSLLRHGADAPPLRAAHRARHDPPRGGARGGLVAARGVRPRRLGGGRGLGAGGALELNIADPAQRSHAVTTIRTAPRRRRAAPPLVRDAAGVTLGVGLGAPGIDPDSMFRIGHMGHLNPPMLLGTLATIEAGFRALGSATARAAPPPPAR